DGANDGRFPLGPPLSGSRFSGVSRAIPRRRARPRKTAKRSPITRPNGNEMEMENPGMTDPRASILGRFEQLIADSEAHRSTQEAMREGGGVASQGEKRAGG